VAAVAAELGRWCLPVRSFHPGRRLEAAAAGAAEAEAAGKAARLEPAIRRSKSASPAVAASSRKPQARPLQLPEAQSVSCRLPFTSSGRPTKLVQERSYCRKSAETGG